MSTASFSALSTNYTSFYFHTYFFAYLGKCLIWCIFSILLEMNICNPFFFQTFSTNFVSDICFRNYIHWIFREGNGNPLQYSCLENPRDGGAWWAAVYGVTQSQTRLQQCSSSSICWIATHCSILAKRIHGQSSLGGYSPWGLKESATTEHLSPTGWCIKLGPNCLALAHHQLLNQNEKMN